jgi:hypothetical protein
MVSCLLLAATLFAAGTAAVATADYVLMNGRVTHRVGI